MNKLLSIVVPVYKVEPYINKCLDSLVLADEELMNQLEVIIVNDGTPDNSAEMSREYVKRYPQTFRQIDKENGGHGSAWNVGLKEATGKYLRFLDSDDWLSNLDRLMEMLSSTDAEIVVTQVSIYYAQENRAVVNQLPVEVIGKELSIATDHFGAGISNFWHATYKTSLLKPLHPLFLEGVSYDDTILCIVPHLMAKTFIVYDFVVYNYLQGREGQSVDLRVVAKKMGDQFKNYKHLESFVAAAGDGVSDRFVNEVLADFRRKMFNVITIIPDYGQSQTYMKDIQGLGGLENIGCRDYKLFKMLPYRLFHLFARTKYEVKKIVKH